MIRRPTAPRGFTLIELVVASGIAGVLLASLASVVLLSSRAMPSSASAASGVLAATAVVDDLRAELRAAERLVAWTDRSIEFTVPDRNADGRPERIRYAWSGVPGDPLERQYGAAPATTVLPDVRQMHLALGRAVRTERFPATAVEDLAETVISEFDTGSVEATSVLVGVGGIDLGLGLGLGGGSEGAGDELEPPSVRLTPTDLAGQMIRPRLPPDAVAWRPTRARVVLDRSFLAGDTVTAQIRTAQHLRPGPQVKASDSIGTTIEVAEFAWSTFAFSSPPLLPHDEEVALVLRGSVDSDKSSTAGWAGDPSVHGRLVSDDGGASWRRRGQQALEHQVSGRILRSTGVSTLHHVAAEQLLLRLEAGVATVLETVVDVPSRPAVDSARWALDLADGDPTSRDDDGDGTPDWALRSGGTFDVDDSPVLDAAPTDALDTPFVVELSGRCEAVGSAITVRVEADNDAAGSMPVLLVLQATATRGQVLSVLAIQGSGFAELASVADLPIGESVSGRLIVDPGAGGVHIVLDGRDRGTLPIRRFGLPPSHRGLTVTFGGTSVAEARVLVHRPEPLP